MTQPLRDPDDTIAVLAHRRLDAGEKRRFLKGEFRKQQEMGRLTLVLGSQPAGCGNPARVTAHHLQNEHPGGGLRHSGHIEGCLAYAGRYIFRDRAKARAAVRDREIVVYGFRYMYRDDGLAELCRDLRDLETGISRVAAAIVEEVPDLVCSEDLQQPGIWRGVYFKA